MDIHEHMRFLDNEINRVNTCLLINNVLNDEKDDTNDQASKVGGMKRTLNTCINIHRQVCRHEDTGIDIQDLILMTNRNLRNLIINQQL